MMASTYAESTTSLKTTQDFLSYLESCYGDPNTSARAAIRLREITQKDNESFATFLPKFEREMADAGGAGWPDVVQINYLEAALNKKMAAQLIPMTQLPTTYRGVYPYPTGPGLPAGKLRTHEQEPTSQPTITKP